MKHILVLFYCISVTFYGLSQNVDAALNDFVRYREAGQYEQAINIGNQLLPYFTDEGNQDLYASMLDALASCYAGLEDFNKAIELEAHVLEIRKRDLGEKHQDYATSLANLAYFYQALSDYTKAIEFWSQASYIYKNTLGDTHPNYAFSLSVLSNCYSYIGDYSKAIELGIPALELFKNIYGENDPNYAIALSNMATNYSHIGNYNRAIELGTRALDVQKQVFSENHPNYASSLSHLANYYMFQGNYTMAIELGTQAMDIRKRILGEKHPDYATSLSNLALCHSNLGDYSKAIELLTQAIDIEKNALGVTHPNYAFSLSDLALNYQKLGNYTKALELGTQALEIRRSILGENHPDYATSLNNLADIYRDLGDYNEAIKLGTQAMDIRKRVLGEKHPDYANSLSNLSLYYPHLGNFSKAIELGKKALEIRKNTVGTNHPDYAASLSNLALCYYYLGDYTKAFKMEQQAADIYKQVFGENHHLYAQCLNNIAYFNGKLGNYTKTIELETKVKDIYKRVLGENHPDYATSLGNLAETYSNLGKYNEAIPLSKELISSIQKNIFSMFTGLTANERLSYWSQYSYSLNSIIPDIIINSFTPDAASMLYDNTALFSKGLLLSTEMEITKLIQESGDQEALHLYSNLHKIRQMLNIQYSKPISERLINCDSLERTSVNLERQLASRVNALGDFTRNLRITWCDVQNKLDENDIAIEFLSYHKNDGSTSYIALTLCRDDNAPILTPLFTEVELSGATDNEKTYQTSTADKLVWGPLSSRLEGKSNVYFSASGILHNIGIEYLPSMEGKDCHRLSSTRELVTHQASPSISSATLYGDIDYNASYASIKSSSPNNMEYYASNSLYGQNRGNFDYRSMRYGVSPLPATRDEINEVSSLLKTHGTHCEKLTGNIASEESFKALSGQRKSLLHISTHGFYYTTEDAENMSDNIRMMFIGDDRPTHFEDQSLLRCGLCLAGANQTLSGESQPSDGQGDGILNALEIAQTDLRGLDLVVLSACQTALGDVSQGEGVFGLQRGFKKAGAQSILMSLWEVDDEFTHIFMTEFYRGWTSGMTKTAALRNAQSIVKAKYPEPRHWAAFILLDALD